MTILGLYRLGYRWGGATHVVAMDWSHPRDLNNYWFKAVTCVLLLPTDNQVNIYLCIVDFQ